MTKYFLPICSVLFICSNNVSAQQTVNDKKAIFIILDGISADIIETTATPNLDEISTVGGYTRAYVGGAVGTYSETPTISAVGYNSLITGVWANKHNVWGNSIKNPNYNYWNLFRIIEKHNPSLKTAIFSTWLDNRTKLIGEELTTAGNIQLDYSFDGFELDTIKFPHDKEKTYISKIDEHVTTKAQSYIKNNGPDLTWVYLEFTDDMGHKYGDSPEFIDTVKLADNQIGRIWNAIKERTQKYDEDWMIVITTDHGRNKETGKNHGGQSDRERLTWIVTNHKNTNLYFNNTPGIVDIMPSILRHLKIPLPKHLVNEVDGTSFIKPILISNLTAIKKGSKINLKWKSYGKSDKATIHITTTNNFKNGGKDSYIQVLKVKTNDEKAVINISKNQTKFYKIVLKSSKNTLNTWVVDE